MRRTRKIVALAVAVVLSMAMSMTALAADNYKNGILSAMDDAAAELGVSGSRTYQNARNSVANYSETITEEQYKAALVEIDNVKNEIASNGVEAVRANKALQDKLINSVIAAAAKVGVTVTYDGSGVGTATAAKGTTSSSTSNPIKATGSDYSGLMVLALAAVAACGSCAAKARKFA